MTENFSNQGETLNKLLKKADNWIKSQDAIDKELESLKNERARLILEIKAETPETISVKEPNALDTARYLTEEQIEEERKNLIIHEIEEDRRGKPYIYFVIEKNHNPYMLQKLIEPMTGLIDLRNISGGPNKIHNPDSIEWVVPNKEGVYSFSYSGFMLIISDLDAHIDDARWAAFYDKDTNALSSNFSSDPFSEEFTFKIIDPNGLTIKEYIKGYTKASLIFRTEVINYQKKMDEEYHV
ncbi:MAG TPA: hypothetical protein VFQ59_01885 [Candidatus Paceibacterota bacterium]|nr:hypothetical protein [Candidatus Paceibacterota bacterium]